MGAAKYNIKTQDRSVILPAMDGIYGACLIVSERGKGPQLITGNSQLEQKFGVANPSYGPSQYAAQAYLSESNKLWVKRVYHKDAKLAAALVRSKIDGTPKEIPGGSWVADKIVNPIPAGLTEEQFDTYQFPVYNSDRVYAQVNITLKEPVNGVKKVRVDNIEELTVKDKLHIGSSPQNGSLLYEIVELESSKAQLDKLTLDGSVTVKAGEKIRMVAKKESSYEPKIILTSQANTEDTTLTVSGVVGVQPNDIILVGEQELVVQSAEGSTITLKGQVGDIISNVPEVEVKKRVYEYKEYQGSPSILRSASGSNEILVNKTDFIANDDYITIGTSDGVSVKFIKVLKKDTYEEDQHFITFDKEVTANSDVEFHKMVKSEFEERDAFLVVSNSVGKWSKHISIAIAPSTAYTDEDVSEDFSLPFNLLVYYKGKRVETFENVSMKQQVDSFRNQMFIETRVNGVSEYIQIKVNPMNTDETGTLKNPLNTNYAIWRQLPEDIFWDVKDTDGVQDTLSLEDILAGDKNIRVSDNKNISIGDRIKFKGFDEEYKVTDKQSFVILSETKYEITLDRGVVISKENPLSKIPAKTQITRFDSTVEDTAKGIYAGVRHFSPSKISNVYYNYPLNVIFTIGGIKGTLLDCGANLMQGGFDGSPVTVGDIVSGWKEFYNKDKYPVNLVMDSGFAFPAVAQELNKLAETRGTCHAYISIDSNAEKRSNYLDAIYDYYAKLMLNSEYSSVFAGWVKTLDANNNVEIYTDPASAAAASQSFTTRNYQIFYPSAGWTRGKVRGLGVLRQFTDGDMDYLVDNRINPVRYKEGSGLVIWGNETSYRKPSPLQMRSVAWLLIMIKHGLESTLDFSLFELNNERTYEALETAIRVFMRDEIKAKGGVYDFQVEVSKIITDSDKEQRRIPVFIGIKPTSDTKFIPVTIAVFSASQKIDVSL